MQRRHKPSKPGQIGGINSAHYSAAKAGIIGFTKSLAREVSKQGITANCIAPGPVATPFFYNGCTQEWRDEKLASLPLGRFGEAEEVAPCALLLAAVVFQMTPAVFCKRALHTILGRSCIELLLITYGLILLQQLMDEHSMLTKAEESIIGLSSNPKLGSVVSPVVSGLLPSPATVLMAGSMLRKRYKGMMPEDSMAFVTTYFRHIPEALLPVYTNVILMCAVTNTPEWLFLLLMLPYIFFNLVVPYFIYLRPIAAEPTAKRPKEPAGTLFQNIFRNL